MGKKIIIKGANFTRNAIYNDGSLIPTQTVWYITSFTDTGAEKLVNFANKANGGWAYKTNNNEKVQGKFINAVKFKAATAGTFNLYTGVEHGESTNLVASFQVEENEVGTVVTKKFETVFIGDKFLIFGEAGTSATQYFGPGAEGFYSKIPTSWVEYGGNLGFDVGYIV